MTGPTLAFALGLEPTKAVEHLRSKGLQVSAGWRTVDESTHARAFTVANVTKLDVLADIQAELLRAQKDGLTMQQFRENIIPALTRKGWFAKRGEPVHVPDGTPPHPVTGELATQKRLTARRLETIFQTNMQSSMMAGRYRELMANVDKRAFFQYVAVMDGKTRPAHRALNGTVLRANDPAWSAIWPPCGYRCRCRVRAHDAADLAERGLQVESSAGRLTTSTVPLPDGSASTVTRYRTASGTVFSTDPGFGGNPARTQAVERLALRRAPEVLPAAQADAALRQLFTHPTREAELKAFAATAREAAEPTGARIAVGALDEAAMLRLADESITVDPSRPIDLADDLVQQAQEVSAEQWATVPEVLAWGSVGWDRQLGALVYVDAPSSVPLGQAMRITVAASADRVAVRSVQLIQRADIPAVESVRNALNRHGQENIPLRP